MAIEAKIYAQDNPIISSIEPRRLGQTLEQVHTLADAYTLGFRRAFVDYVSEYGAEDSVVTGVVGGPVAD